MRWQNNSPENELRVKSELNVCLTFYSSKNTKKKLFEPT